MALSLLTVLSSALTAEQFLGWGWRIPFLLAAVFTVVCVMLRRKLDETPEFERLERERRGGRTELAYANPFRQLAVVFRQDPRNFTAAFLLPCAVGISGYVAQVFGISYLKTSIGLSSTQALTATLIMMIVGLPVMVFFGWLSDRIGAKKVLYIGGWLGIPIGFAYFVLAQTGNFGLVVLASCLLWAVASACSAAQMVLMPSLFRPQFRGTGMVSARELEGGIIAGPAPFIAAALALALNGAPWLVAVYIGVGQLLTIVGMLVARPPVSQAEIDRTPALRGLRPALPARAAHPDDIASDIADPSNHAR